MFQRLRGWWLRRYYSVKPPYEIDRGEYGKRGWQAEREVVVNTALSYSDLNRARGIDAELLGKVVVATGLQGSVTKILLEEEQRGLKDSHTPAPLLEAVQAWLGTSPAG